MPLGKSEPGTYQLLAYAVDVDLLDGNLHAVKTNTDASLAASKAVGLEPVLRHKSLYSCLDKRVEDKFIALR
jgi:hypothetical protein